MSTLTPLGEALSEATGIRLPDHVRRAYKWVALRNVFLDRKGRVWYAETDELRRMLPADPLGEQKVPPDFWHASARDEYMARQHAERKAMLEEARAEEEARPRRRERADLELVP